MKKEDPERKMVGIRRVWETVNVRKSVRREFKRREIKKLESQKCSPWQKVSSPDCRGKCKGWGGKGLGHNRDAEFTGLL